MSWGCEAHMGGMHRVSGSGDPRLGTAHCYRNPEALKERLGELLERRELRPRERTRVVQIMAMLGDYEPLAAYLEELTAE